MTEKQLDPRMTAGIDLARRTGAKQVQIRYSDDEEPVIWMAVAGHTVRNGRAVVDGKINAWSVGAATDPTRAVLALLDDLIDGGYCKHCERPTGVAHDLDDMPLSEAICWYQFDPELVTYRRSCEGET